ncbi:MAG: phospho-N-acetylmuramoyl-pentapeptide-transferase [Erysipelotrichaceae bacterium]|nr:phospho-N-acetylmuramoyl-pentapeptide-transferase [Erysipelotrichaceae bacterium]
MYINVVIAGLVSLLLVLVLMPILIKFLKSLSVNQSVNQYALEQYKTKEKTPIMGGILFVIVPILITFIFVGISNIGIFIVMLSFFGYSIIGFIDDYLIFSRSNNNGLSARNKFLLQLLLAIVFFVLYKSYVDLSIFIPILKINVNISYFYIVLIFFMLTGSSNAVNLTDGMDGLAGGCMVIALIPYLVFSIIDKNYQLSIFISSLIGALIGYLKFNISPAKIYMGDTGSLALGAVLAAISIVMKKEVLLIIIGGVFVWETLCVIIQIGSVKLRGKRVFKYTPIHYSFVLDGVSEKRVVKSFWILASIFSFLGLFIGLI